MRMPAIAAMLIASTATADAPQFNACYGAGGVVVAHEIVDSDYYCSMTNGAITIAAGTQIIDSTATLEAERVTIQPGVKISGGRVIIRQPFNDAPVYMESDNEQ